MDKRKLAIFLEILLLFAFLGFRTTLKFSLNEKCSDFDENLRHGWT